jgi:hypothetical protein
MALSRAQILAAKPATVPVEVPGLGSILIRPLTVGGLGLFMDKRESLSGIRSLLLLFALSAVDDLGEPLFDPEDEAGLSAVPFEAVKLVADQVMVINKIGGEGDGKKSETTAPETPPA